MLHVTADHEASEEEVLHADMGACDEQADKDGNEVAEVVLEWMGVCGRSGNGCTEFVMLLVDVLVDAWVVQSSMDSVEADIFHQETNEPLSDQFFA